MEPSKEVVVIPVEADAQLEQPKAAISYIEAFRFVCGCAKLPCVECLHIFGLEV